MTGSARRPLFFLFLGLFLAVSPVLASEPPVVPETETASPEPSAPKDNALPIQIHGDTVDYFQQEEKAIGTGNVSVDYQGANLKADKITVYMPTKKALAEGNVVLTQKGSVLKGERAEYDFGKGIGIVDKLDAEIAPSYYGKARTVEKLPPDQYRFTDTYLTTCCGDNPFYKIQAKTIDIYPEKKIVIKHALLFIKGVPVLYIPYYVQYLANFDRFPVELIPGKNSEWGAFLLSKWRYNLVHEPNHEQRGNVLLDYRDRRGPAGGIEHFYKSDRIGRGAVRTYYVPDEEPPMGNAEDRYRVQWRHQTQLNESTQLTAELHRLSDPTIVKDFFYREEYEEEVGSDSYVSLITHKSEYALQVFDREQVNHFQTVVEKSPEVKFDTQVRPLADTPFYFRQEAQAANLKKQQGDSDLSNEAVRAELRSSLYYGARVGALSVTPRLSVRETYYSRRIDSDDDLSRTAFEPGLDLSMRFYKIYDTYLNVLGAEYKQIRHIFTPTARLYYRPEPTAVRSVLQEFDDIDRLEEENLVRFDFENKFQTRYSTGKKGELASRDFLRVINFFDADLQTQHLERMGVDAEWRPTEWLSVWSDATYDTRLRQFEAANVDVSVWISKNLSFSFGQRFLYDESSQSTFDMTYKLNDEWSFHLYERFEFDGSDQKEFEFTVTKAYECVITDFTYNHREDGDTFFVTMRLKAFPGVPFRMGQTYNSPTTGQPIPGLNG